MYKRASQSRQTHLSRKAVFDAGADAARKEALPISKKQQRKNFGAAIAELERQIAMANPGSARRKELGLQKQALQRMREAEKGNGHFAGKPNAKRISDLFRDRIFDLLPDDAQRIWDGCVAIEKQEREAAIHAVSE